MVRRIVDSTGGYGGRRKPSDPAQPLIRTQANFRGHCHRRCTRLSSQRVRQRGSSRPTSNSPTGHLVSVRAASSVSDNDGPDASVRRVGVGGRGALPFGIDHATSRRRRANTTTTPTAKKIRLIFAKDSLLDEGPVVGSDWTVVVGDELAGTVVVGAT